MKRWQNLGTLDRLLRAVVGVVLLGVAALASLGTTWTAVALVVAALMLVTAAAGYCPAYAPLGWRTTGRGSGHPTPA